MPFFQEHASRGYHMPTYATDAEADYWAEQLQNAEAWAQGNDMDFEWIEESQGRFHLNAMGTTTHQYIEPDETDRRIAEADLALEFYRRGIV